MESLDKMDKSFIDSKAEIISNSEYIILDSDNPEIMEYLLTNFRDKTNFILDPVSATKAEKIKHLVRYFHTIKPNRIEAEVLCGFKINNIDDIKRAGQYFLALGVKNVFISLDEEGIYFTNGTEEGKIFLKRYS